MNIEILKMKFNTKGLEDEIVRRLGLAVGLKIKDSIKIQIVPRRNDEESYKVEVESCNLADRVGVLDQVMQDVRISNFGGMIEKTISNKTRAWVPLHMAWKSKGGSNGLPWFNAYYTFETSTWEFSKD